MTFPVPTWDINKQKLHDQANKLQCIFCFYTVYYNIIWKSGGPYYSSISGEIVCILLLKKNNLIIILVDNKTNIFFTAHCSLLAVAQFVTKKIIMYIIVI